ncbi:MAG: ABC transporter ATP-binding protein, partial [Planctomycetes bacterium]|nr:ABC transporter ATP-binding protein [Planctomycetota bacterium]
MFYVLGGHKGALGLIFVLCIVLACLNQSLPYLLKIVIDDIFKPGRFEYLWYVLGAVAVIIVARNAVYYPTKSRMSILGEQIAFEVRTSLFEHLHRLSVAFYRRHRPGTISSRLMQDVTEIKTFIRSELIKLFMNALMLLVAVGIMLWLNWLLALISLAVLPFHWLIHRRFRGSIKKFSRQAQDYLGDLSGDVVEQFSGVETVKSAVAEPQEQEKFQRSMRKGMSAQITRTRYYLLQKVAADALIGVGMILVIGFGGYAVKTGTMGVGEFVAFFTYTGALYPRVLALVKQAGKFSSTASSVDRIYEILHTEPDVTEPPHAQKYEITAGRVEFQNVSFSYQDERVLEDVSFKVEAGEHIMITGPSGSGKTTLLNLIPRFYDVDTGTIRMDGRDIEDFTLSSLR